MPRFSANISTLYTEVPFLERFAAAKEDGFDAVEFWFPYEHPLESIRSQLQENELELVGINSHSGSASEWGLAAVPGREEAFASTIDQAIEYAAGLGAGGLHVMAGLAQGHASEVVEKTYLQNLELALRKIEQIDVTMLIEPLNSIDRPGYWLTRVDEAARYIRELGSDSVKIMFDCYHVYMQEDKIADLFVRHRDLIGHIQVASCPGRRELDSGEEDFADLFKTFDQHGWTGCIGLEYFPKAETRAGLDWLRRYKLDGAILPDLAKA